MTKKICHYESLKLEPSGGEFEQAEEFTVLPPRHDFATLVLYIIGV